MTRQAETLTQLVAERVGEGRELTYRKFEERAVDPETGRGPSRDVLWKIGTGKTIKVDPAVVRAVAVGLSLPLERVQRAAAYQYTGLVSTEVAGGLILHDPAAGGDTPGSEKAVRQQREREGDVEE